MWPGNRVLETQRSGLDQNQRPEPGPEPRSGSDEQGRTFIISEFRSGRFDWESSGPNGHVQPDRWVLIHLRLLLSELHGSDSFCFNLRVRGSLAGSDWTGTSPGPGSSREKAEYSFKAAAHTPHVAHERYACARGGGARTHNPARAHSLPRLRPQQHRAAAFPAAGHPESGKYLQVPKVLVLVLVRLQLRV